MIFSQSEDVDLSDKTFTIDNVIRDPDKIIATDHVGQQRTSGGRQITWYQVKKAISEAPLDPDEANEPHQMAYRMELPVDLVIIVDQDNRKVVTAYYDDNQGATGGRL